MKVLVQDPCLCSAIKLQIHSSPYVDSDNKHPGLVTDPKLRLCQTDIGRYLEGQGR